MKNINKIAENIIAVDRTLMRKIEDFILSADKETLEHIEKIVNERKKQLEKTSNWKHDYENQKVDKNWKPLDYQNPEVKKLRRHLELQTKGMTAKEIDDFSGTYPEGSVENRLLQSIWADANGTPGF